MKFFKTWFVFLVLFLIFLASSWDLFGKAVYRVHDSTHVSRIAEMSRALQDGHFPVRWTENFGFGYGMPLFEFYAPLPFYLASVVFLVTGRMILSLRLLFIISNFVSLLGAYALGKKLFGRQGGLIAAASFTLAPYRAVNLFVRGALSEAWGLMTLPWILFFIIKILDDKKTKFNLSYDKNWVGLVISLVVMMLSHNLTTLMFIPVSILFGIFYLFFKASSWFRKQYLNKIIKLFLAYLLASLLSAFYLIPAFIEKDFTKVGQILGGYFHYSFHFLYIRQFFMDRWGYGGSILGLEDGMSFFLGWGQLLALFMGLILLFLNLIKNFNLKKFVSNNFLYLSFLFILGITLFLTIFKSKFIWDRIPLLAFIQFPWRFMAVAILFLSLFNAGILKLIKNKLLRFLIFLVLLLLIFINAAFFHFEKHDNLPWEYACQSEECIKNRMSSVLPDYIPIDTADPALLPTELDFLGVNDAKLLVNRTQEKLWQLKLANNKQISLPVSYYPGWQIELDGEKVKTQKDELGLLAAEIPAGEHKLGIVFTGTNIRNIADILSFLSFIVFLYILIELRHD